MDRMELQRLFSIAIKREVEAHEFYRKIAERMEDAGVKEVFGELAAEELGHKETLERFQADPSLEMKFQVPAADFKVAEATELPALTIEMKPADAIALAMKKEQQAVEFYRGLADSTGDGEMKGIFGQLANMEMGHKSKLENIFVEIGYPEAW
jgi:rubrerythrin